MTQRIVTFHQEMCRKIIKKTSGGLEKGRWKDREEPQTAAWFTVCHPPVLLTLSRQAAPCQLQQGDLFSPKVQP